MCLHRGSSGARGGGGMGGDDDMAADDGKGSGEGKGGRVPHCLNRIESRSMPTANADG